MKTSTLTILNSFKLLKRRSLRSFKMVSLAKIGTIKSVFPKLISLSLGRLDRIKARVRMSNNLIQFIQRMSVHHGDAYTIKWLKCSSVALQKYIAGDPISSLRSLEPKIPLPRLINGCPSIISKTDRKLIREGNTWVRRFWLTQFALYRVLKFPSRVDLSSITDPYSGSSSFLIQQIQLAKDFNPFAIYAKDFKFLPPTTLVFSQKSSPSNGISYQGILTDYHNLSRGSWILGEDLGPRLEWLNIVAYVEVLRKSGLNMRRWDSIIHSLDSLLENLKINGMKLPSKSSIFGTGLSQFALKHESAGKIRIFALLDSISQSVLRPLHDSLFDILRCIPNDGTFDQDASVSRSADKLAKYGVAYSLDLSSATDRLPSRLTAQILQSILSIEGFGDAWLKVMIDRDFCLSSLDQVYALEGEKYIPQYFRYSVGQPMGGLSSWAGLAITHHWIMQAVSLRCSRKFSNLSLVTWEDRYEVLGDDIVIFDENLAQEYLIFMRELGVGINLTKSLSKSSDTFEFAKRTISRGVNISGLSFQQALSSSSLGSRVSDAYTYSSLGLVRTASHLGHLLAAKPTSSSFRKMKEIGLPALSLYNLLFSKEIIELERVLECIVNPRFEDFDFEKAKFDLPLHSMLRHCLDLIRLKGSNTSEWGLAPSGVLPSSLAYPFSRQDDREEVSSEYEPHLVAVILQEALAKSKTLVRDYENLIKRGAVTVYKGQGTKLLQAQVSGFFEDLIIEFSDLDVSDFCDEIESMLYRHAKYPKYSISEALSTLDRVENLIFRFTFKTEMSRSKYEQDSSPIIKMLRKSEGSIPIPYWQTSALP
nr:RNA-dependent RNA polymerase [Botrytis cinerea mitovirus 10]